MGRPRTFKSHVVGSRVLVSASCVVGLVLLVSISSAVVPQTPSSAGPADPALIEDLIAANRILYQEGIVDGFGHVSVRHDRDPSRFLMSRSLAPELVSADDIIEYDLNGVPVNLNGRSQYSERFIHAEIYKARPDVGSVVHNHSPGVVPFGVSSAPLLPVYHMAAFIGEGIPIFDLQGRFGNTEMLVNDEVRGGALAQVLSDRPAVLIRGHGVAVVGENIPFSVGRSIYLEMNARIQAQAMALGGDVTYLTVGESEAVMAAGENRRYERPWEMWKRQVMGQ